MRITPLKSVSKTVKSMFQLEKTQTERKAFDSNELQTSLIFRIFATNFAVGDLHASYERHFVKKIQHLISFHAVYLQVYMRCMVGVFRCKNIIHFFACFFLIIK